MTSINFLAQEYYKKALAGDIGGGSLSQAEADFMSHWTVDKVQKRLKADWAVGTTLNSIYLEDQFAISAGGHALFFKNLTKQTNHWAPSGFLLGQETVANRGPAGVVNARNVIYGGNLLQQSLKGAITTTAAITPYSGVTGPLTTNVSLWGTRVRLGQDIVDGQTLKYSIWDGVDNTGSRLFYQEFDIVTTTAQSNGEFMELWWDHPGESLLGDTVYAEIMVVEEGQPDVLLNVYALESDSNNHWNEVYFRTFTFEFIATENSLNQAIGDVEFEIAQRIGADTIHTSDGETIYWLNGEEILWSDVVSLKVDTSRWLITVDEHQSSTPANPKGMFAFTNKTDDISGGSSIVWVNGPQLLAGVTYRITTQLCCRNTTASVGDVVMEWREVGQGLVRLDGMTIMQHHSENTDHFLLTMTANYTPTVDTELGLYAVDSPTNGFWFLGTTGRWPSWVQIEILR